MRLARAADLLAASELPRPDARALLAHVLRVERERLLAHPDLPVALDATANFDALAARRRAGEPLAYLLGNREFYGRLFIVTSDVLIPRPETELVVDIALATVESRAAPRIADLGTGSGCVALTLALERPDAAVTASDISAAALGVARANAAALNASNVHFVQGDWFVPLADTGPFNVIVSNPPYVAVGDPHLTDLAHEPQQALTAGVDGLECLRRISAEAADFLVDDGVLVLEHGFEQGAAVRALLKVDRWSAIETFDDAAGHPRVTRACRS